MTTTYIVARAIGFSQDITDCLEEGYKIAEANLLDVWEYIPSTVCTFKNLSQCRESTGTWLKVAGISSKTGKWERV